MTRIACGWRRAIAIAAFSTALAAPAYAQQSLGTVLRACGALDANRQLAVQATGGAPAGSVLVASVAGRADVLGDVRIVDPTLATWDAIGARRTRAAEKLEVAQLATRATATLSASQSYAVRIASSVPGTEVCFAIVAFADVASGPGALQSRAAAGGTSAAPSLTGGAAGDGTTQLLVAAFALAGDPAGFSAAQAGDVAASTCTATATLCLGTVSRTDPGTGALTLGATLGTAVAWSGALASLDREALLRDGFE